MKPVDEQLFTLAPHDELEAFVEQTMPQGRQVLGDLEYEFLLFKRKVHAADTEFWLDPSICNSQQDCATHFGVLYLPLPLTPTSSFFSSSSHHSFIISFLFYAHEQICTIKSGYRIQQPRNGINKHCSIHIHNARSKYPILCVAVCSDRKCRLCSKSIWHRKHRCEAVRWEPCDQKCRLDGLLYPVVLCGICQCSGRFCCRAIQILASSFFCFKFSFVNRETTTY